ncbi:MAG: inositol monophosphatase family protein, partial [Geminicoccaceae bacterium]
KMFKQPGEHQAFSRVEDAVALPMYGGDCYAYGLLAMGFADLIVEADLDTHDYLALIPVIEGAGGIITDWEGKTLTPGSEGRVLAAGDRRVHAEALVHLTITSP